MFWSFSAVWLAWGWGLWGDLAGAGTDIGVSRDAAGHSTGPLWFGSTTPQLASPRTHPQEYRWRYLLLHLFSAPSQVVSQPLLSDLCVSVANHSVNVQEQKSRWRLRNKRGIVQCMVGVGLPGQGLAGARTSYLPRCCFCWGVDFLKRHAGIWLCSCVSQWKCCY